MPGAARMTAANVPAVSVLLPDAEPEAMQRARAAGSRNGSMNRGPAARKPDSGRFRGGDKGTPYLSPKEARVLRNTPWILLISARPWIISAPGGRMVGKCDQTEMTLKENAAHRDSMALADATKK
jgi:hypothetical protein